MKLAFCSIIYGFLVCPDIFTNMKGSSVKRLAAFINLLDTECKTEIHSKLEGIGYAYSFRFHSH